MDLKKELKNLNKGKLIRIRCHYNQKIKWLYLDYYSSGERRFIFPKLCITGNTAKDKQTLRILSVIRDDYEYKIRYNATGNPIFNKASDTPRLLDFAQSSIINMKPRTKEFYMSGIRSLVAYMGNERLATYNKAKISKWIEALTISPQSKHNYLRAVKRIFNLAIEDKILKENPCAGIACKYPQSNRVFLTLEEIRAIAEVPFEFPAIQDAFVFSCFTGLRLGDIIDLKWSNIVEEHIVHIQGKTGSAERIKLHPKAREILEKQPKVSSQVFTLHAKKRFYMYFKKLIQQSGIPKKVTFHCARHTFATQLVINNVELLTISKLMGHKDIKTTLIYAKMIDKVKDDAIDKLPGF